MLTKNEGIICIKNLSKKDPWDSLCLEVLSRVLISESLTDMTNGESGHPSV